MGAVQQCPNCGAEVNARFNGCTECGYNFLTKSMPKTPVTGPRPTEKVDRLDRMATAVEEGSETVIYSIAMVVLIGASIVLLIAGFFSSEMSAIQQTSIFAAAAVCGILARIAQAAKQHVKVMRELKRR